MASASLARPVPLRRPSLGSPLPRHYKTRCNSQAAASPTSRRTCLQSAARRCALRFSSRQRQASTPGDAPTLRRRPRAPRQRDHGGGGPQQRRGAGGARGGPHGAPLGHRAAAAGAQRPGGMPAVVAGGRQRRRRRFATCCFCIDSAEPVGCCRVLPWRHIASPALRLRCLRRRRQPPQPLLPRLASPQRNLPPHCIRTWWPR